MRTKEERYLFRKKRVREKIYGTAERPRLSVYRSPKHIYAQIINDEEGKTLVSASTLSPELRNKLKIKGKIAAAKAVGELIARKAKDLGMKKVVFDRGGRIYHGRVKSLAEGAREGGLEF